MRVSSLREEDLECLWWKGPEKSSLNGSEPFLLNGNCRGSSKELRILVLMSKF